MHALIKETTLLPIKAPNKLKRKSPKASEKRKPPMKAPMMPIMMLPIKPQPAHPISLLARTLVIELTIKPMINQEIRLFGLDTIARTNVIDAIFFPFFCKKITNAMGNIF
jgi:hypothetical protein